MGRDLTLSRARYLAEQSHAVGQSRRPSPGSAILEGGGRYLPPAELPWHIRHLASLIVGGALTVVVGITLLVTAALNDDPIVQQTSDVEALVGVIEKQIDADLEKARMAEERLARQRAEKEREQEEIENQDQTFMVQVIFWTLLGAVFLMISAQYSGIWGVGIGMFVIVLIFGVVFVPGVLDLARAIMVSS